MHRRLGCFAAALAIALSVAPASAFADPPKVVLKQPERVNTGDLVWLSATGSTGDIFQWGHKLGPDFVGEGLSACVRFDEPGEYEIEFRAIGVVEGKAVLERASFKVSVIERPAPPPPVPPTPDPGPTPGPTPTPPAPVVAGTMHVSLVVDGDGMTQGLAALREGIKVRPALSPLDVHYRTYLATSPDLDRLNLRGVVAKVGPPCLIVQDRTGKVIASEKAPIDEDGMIARIKMLRGAGK